MNEADVEAEAFGAAFLVHEAGHVGRNDVLGPGTVMVLDLVVAHFGRYRLLEHRKRAAEAAAFIRPARRHELDASHFAQEIERFREERFLDFRSFRGPQLAQRRAGVVQPDLMRKLRPRELVDLDHVMQKLDEFVGAAADSLDLRRLRDRVEMRAHVVGATPRRRNDGVELGKIGDEQGLGAGRILLTTGVRHRLTAARLVERIDRIDAEPFQELQRRDADIGKKGIDVARNE